MLPLLPVSWIQALFLNLLISALLPRLAPGCSRNPPLHRIKRRQWCLCVCVCVSVKYLFYSTVYFHNIVKGELRKGNCFRRF